MRSYFLTATRWAKKLALGAALVFCFKMHSSDARSERKDRIVYFFRVGGIDCHKLMHDINAYRDEVGLMCIKLREGIESLGLEVRIAEDVSNLRDAYAIFSFNEADRSLLAKLSRYPKEKCFLFIMEPPVVMPSIHDPRLKYHFGSIFTLFDDPVDDVSFFKLHYPQPRLKVVENIPSFQERKLAVLINSNKDSNHPNSLYGERRKAIQFFSQTDDFDLYGCSWDGYPAWKGTIPNKWNVIKNYKFSICHENMGMQRGYITEKIFDAMVGGSVPIYWGADNVQDYIPKECFIDRRDFQSDEELYHFLKGMSEDAYKGHLKAIQEYFDSPKSDDFSVDSFVERVIQRLKEIR